MCAFERNWGRADAASLVRHTGRSSREISFVWQLGHTRNPMMDLNDEDVGWRVAHPKALMRGELDQENERRDQRHQRGCRETDPGRCFKSVAQAHG